MSNIKRLCRVCMVNDWNGNLIPIFQDAGNRTALDIFTISGVQVWLRIRFLGKLF